MGSLGIEGSNANSPRDFMSSDESEPDLRSNRSPRRFDHVPLSTSPFSRMPINLMSGESVGMQPNALKSLKQLRQAMIVPHKERTESDLEKNRKSKQRTKGRFMDNPIVNAQV